MWPSTFERELRRRGLRAVKGGRSTDFLDGYRNFRYRITVSWPVLPLEGNVIHLLEDLRSCCCMERRYPDWRAEIAVEPSSSGGKGEKLKEILKKVGIIEIEKIEGVKKVRVGIFLAKDHGDVVVKISKRGQKWETYRFYSYPSFLSLTTPPPIPQLRSPLPEIEKVRPLLEEIFQPPFWLYFRGGVLEDFFL
jgi:hypothetical protein